MAEIVSPEPDTFMATLCRDHYDALSEVTATALKNHRVFKGNLQESALGL